MIAAYEPNALRPSNLSPSTRVRYLHIYPSSYPDAYDSQIHTDQLRLQRCNLEPHNTSTNPPTPLHSNNTTLQHASRSPRNPVQGWQRRLVHQAYGQVPRRQPQRDRTFLLPHPAIEGLPTVSLHMFMSDMYERITKHEQTMATHLQPHVSSSKCVRNGLRNKC